MEEMQWTLYLRERYRRIKNDSAVSDSEVLHGISLGLDQYIEVVFPVMKIKETIERKE